MISRVYNWAKEKAVSALRWVKYHAKKILVGVGIIAVAFAASSVTTNDATLPPPPLNHNGEEISFEYTDENENEDIIIYTTQDRYSGWGEVTVPFAVVNTTDNDESVEVRGLFSDVGKIEKLYRHYSDVEKTRTVSEYGQKDISCSHDWTASTTEEADGSTIDGYACDMQFEACDSVSGETCHYDNTYLGTTTETYIADEWQEVTLSAPNTSLNDYRIKEIPKGFEEKVAHTVTVPAQSSQYFKAEISFDSKPFQKKNAHQFLLEGISDSGKTGLLDPWFDSSYSFCRSFTMNSSQVATTTTNGFAMAATSTISDLKHTSHGGDIQVLKEDDSNTPNQVPQDVVFTSGTDCNDDGGSKIDFYFEEYASTTGAFTAWVEPTDVSSTTDKTILMYYGNSSATDQENESGVFGGLSEEAVWNLHEDPGSAGSGGILDSTANNTDGTDNGSMTSDDLVAGQVDGSLELDGGDDYIDAGDGFEFNTDFTLSLWVYANTINQTDQDTMFSKDADADTFMRFEIDAENQQCTNDSLRLIYNETNFCGTSNISENTWYFFTITADLSNDELTFYVDSAVDATRSFTVSSNSNNAPIRIGVDDLDQFIGAKLDNVSVYSRVLTSADIETQHNNMVDSSTFWTIGAEETEDAGGAANRQPRIITF